MLAPGLLRLHDVFANGGIFDEQPRLIQQEQLECGKFVGIANLRGGAMEHIEKQRFEDLRCIIPAVEIEGLEAGKRQGIFDVIEEKSVLPVLSPSVQSVLQVAHNPHEIRQCSKCRLEYVNAFDRVPQLTGLREVHLVPLLAPFDENAEEREEELPVVLGRGEGKRVDSEVSGLLANVQIGPPKMDVKDWKLLRMSKM